MAVDYREVQSPFIRTLIRQSSFAEHERIDDLVQLRRYLMEGVEGPGGGLNYSTLQSRYPQEFRELFAEVSDERMLALRHFQPGQPKTKAKRKTRAPEGTGLHCWLAAGGRP